MLNVKSFKMLRYKIQYRLLAEFKSKPSRLMPHNDKKAFDVKNELCYHGCVAIN